MIVHPPDVPNVEERLAEDEWPYLIRNYPQIAFNRKAGGTKLNLPREGHRHLYTAEPQTFLPENFDLDIVNQYDTLITWNDKFAEQVRTDVRIVDGVIGYNAYYALDYLPEVYERTDGVCVLNNLLSLTCPGSIYHLRGEVSHRCSQDMPVHIWSTAPWGGDCYQGAVEAPHHHSHLNHLKKLSEYRFCLCFESTYHELWSWGFLTERMFNCFRAGTVPIYLGCWNIEDYVPPELFINYREYLNNPSDLVGRIQSMTDNQWIEMTSRAYMWQQQNRIGNIADQEAIIRNLA